jgi:two-component system CheB/CheR fusion protein
VLALSTSNEELLASNEELRVTTEELETSKEELHSLNEELRTVNDELKHRVDEISAANDDLGNLMAATEIATLFLDRKLSIKRYTPLAQSLFNLIRGDETRPLAHITHQLNYPNLIADAAAVLDSGQALEREIDSHTGQHFLVRITPYRTGSNRIDGVVLTFVDISERKQAEDELARAYAAEQSARSTIEKALYTRDQFLSIASHELRTPMTALLGYARLLHQAILRGQGDLLKMVERVVKQTKRLDALIDQLLDVSRLQRGQFSIEHNPIDLTALGAHVVADFRDTLPLATADAIRLASPVEPIMVLGDAARLEQVLFNLLSNAIKYSSSGATVQMHIVRTDSEAVLEVIDQGIGIPANVQNDIFAPFFRAANIGSQTSGFGLGLYIVQEIVQRHGGQIEVESVERVGSTFRVRLPLLKE